MEEKSLFKQLEKELKSLEEIYWIISDTELDIRYERINNIKNKLKHQYNYSNEILNKFDF